MKLRNDFYPLDDAYEMLYEHNKYDFKSIGHIYKLAKRGELELVMKVVQGNEKWIIERSEEKLEAIEASRSEAESLFEQNGGSKVGFNKKQWSIFNGLLGEKDRLNKEITVPIPKNEIIDIVAYSDDSGKRPMQAQYNNETLDVPLSGVYTTDEYEPERVEVLYDAFDRAIIGIRTNELERLLGNKQGNNNAEDNEEPVPVKGDTASLDAWVEWKHEKEGLILARIIDESVNYGYKDDTAIKNSWRRLGYSKKSY